GGRRSGPREAEEGLGAERCVAELCAGGLACEPGLHRYSMTPSRPLWLPMYHSRPWASTVIFRMPTPFAGSGETRRSPVRGSRRTTVSVSISLTHTIPPPSTLTAYGPPVGPAGSPYSLMTLLATGSM